LTDDFIDSPGESPEPDSMDIETAAAIDTREPLSEMPTLRAPRAFLILGGFLAAQLTTGIAMGMFAVIRAVLRGEKIANQQDVARITEEIMPIAAFLGITIAGIAVLLLSLALVRKHLKNGGPNGAAWTLGSVRGNAIGLTLGATAAALYLGLAFVIGATEEQSMGPFTRMAYTPGTPRTIWIVIAVLLAPPIEEILFRGILFGGFHRSFGSKWAAFLTTVIFVIMHFAEVVHSWTGAVGITALAVIALQMRIRCKSVGPAIAVHFAYNGVLVLLVVLIT